MRWLVSFIILISGLGCLAAAFFDIEYLTQSMPIYTWLLIGVVCVAIAVVTTAFNIARHMKNLEKKQHQLH